MNTCFGMFPRLYCYALAAALVVPAAGASDSAKTDTAGQVIEKRGPDSTLIDPLAHSGWRSAWSIELTATPESADRIPDSLTVRVVNRGKHTLMGSNLLFSVYGADCWAINEELRAREIKLAPGETFEWTVDFRTLKFHGYRGDDLESETVFERLRGKAWSIACSLSDMHSPKPLIESSFSVRSNLLRFNQDVAD